MSEAHPTDAELTEAARRLCRRHGWNPEAPIGPNRTRTFLAELTDELRAHAEKQTVLEEVIRERGQQGGVPDRFDQEGGGHGD